MKKIFFLVPVLLSSLLFSFPVRADLQGCTNQVIKEIDSKLHDYQDGKIVETVIYQGMNYHLIFLDGGWKEVELVIKENDRTCEELVYNPTGSAVDYSSIMPSQVAKTLDAAARKYSKQIWEKKKADQEHQ